MAQKVCIRKTERGVNRNGIYRKILFCGENSAQKRTEKQNISIYICSMERHGSNRRLYIIRLWFYLYISRVFISVNTRLLYSETTLITKVNS